VISPWAWEAVLASPDGEKTARIDDALEIAMGAPTSGRLVVCTGLSLESCNPSMVWSDDSRYLAVPRWTPTQAQQLVIVDVVQAVVRVAPGRYSVLQLESFEGGVVHGVNSPIHQPRIVSVAVARMLSKGDGG
jgi:hypothetical protein